MVRDVPGSVVEGEPGGTATIRLTLLGGFRAEHRVVVPESAWQQRRSAKTLVKLLASHPAHSLHREQILDTLWPEMDFLSALNSFGKALHVARRALEPNMPSRSVSSYLRLSDEILSLVTDSLWIDADSFQQRAEESLRRGDIASLERAAALYAGELLPEDMYETWTIARRTALAELHVRLLLALGEAFERRGQRDEAIERLNHVIRLDPAREDVHRRLMQLHVATGRRLLALRQYQLCCDALKQELDAEPESATVALYDEIRADRLGHDGAAGASSTGPTLIPPVMPLVDRTPLSPLVGRASVLTLLTEAMDDAEKGNGTTIFVTGPLGVGKSRVVEEIAREAAVLGCAVLWGAGLQADATIPYAPFVHALEMYAASCDPSEQRLWADRYPVLADVLASLPQRERESISPVTSRIEPEQLFSAIVRILTDLAGPRTVLLVLEDLQDASERTLQLLQYLVHLAGQRRLVIVATLREEDVPSTSSVPDIMAAATRRELGHHVPLPLLERDDCDALVEAMIEGPVPTAVLEHLWSASSGNPFLITELIRELQRGELSPHGKRRTTRSDPDVPHQVAAAVDAHVRRMDARAQRIAALVALAGPDVAFRELHLAVNEAIDPGMTAAELLDILDSGLQTGLISERASGYTITYPLVRAALCNQLSRQRRTQLHAAIAHALEACRPSEVELLAYHYGRNDDREQATLYLRRAAERARTSGLRDVEETHLWKLLERLHVMGRAADAEEVRASLRTLIHDEDFGDIGSPHAAALERDAV